jgi:23S rRNA (adenine2503-C2)-methyltransferase
MRDKHLIYDFDIEEITDILQSWGEPSYRGMQVWVGLYQQLHATWDDFTTLPLTLRERLKDEFAISHLRPEGTLASTDGQTIKTLFRLPDGLPIEVVLMRYHDRRTLCISSQSGCAMGCVFCATGQMGFQRHLSSGEIVEQVVYYARQLEVEGERVTNIVLMGMGEPFHNYDASMGAIDRLNHPDGLNLGARRFTVSTVGLVPVIRRFADEGRQVNLAVSLHTTDDVLRSSMIPVNRKHPVDELLAACWEYVRKTKRRITFEWALIRDVNDGQEHARQLGQRLQGMLCHVNVIPLNPTEGYAGEATTEERAAAFQSELEKAGIPCTVRVRRGIDIQAGCGQLASENTK